MTNSCPKCASKAIKKNGYTRHGKQNHRCLDCGRQFSMECDEESFNALFSTGKEGEYYISATIIDG